MWNASLHVQHAAEAAALAGVPYMPGDFATASSKAQAEAAKNGYSERRPARRSARRSTSSPTAGSTSPSAETFQTYFMRIVGMSTVRISRVATAEYTLPVPMGSPLSSYGDNTGLLLGRRRGAGHEPVRRRRVRDLLQPQPDPEQPVRRERLPVRDRRAGRGGQHEHRPVRPDVLRSRRPEGHGRSLDRLGPGRLAGRVDLLHALVGPGLDAARLLGRRRRRLDRHAVREQAPGRQERGAIGRTRRPGRPTPSGACPTAPATRTTTGGGRSRP